MLLALDIAHPVVLTLYVRLCAIPDFHAPPSPSSPVFFPGLRATVLLHRALATVRWHRRDPLVKIPLWTCRGSPSLVPIGLLRSLGPLLRSSISSTSTWKQLPPAAVDHPPRTQSIVGLRRHDGQSPSVRRPRILPTEYERHPSHGGLYHLETKLLAHSILLCPHGTPMLPTGRLPMLRGVCAVADIAISTRPPTFLSQRPGCFPPAASQV